MPDQVMQNVVFERRDRVAIITLSRPERLNAVSPAMVEELHAALDELAVDTETWVVVLTGAGRGFCAGMDIQGGDPSSVQSSEGRMQRIFRGISRGGEAVAKLREIPQPVIGALHGPVAGMGMSFALACDLRVADPTTKFVSPFTNLGLSGGDLGLSWLLPRVVGPAKAAEILYRSQTLRAEQLYTLGLVTEMADEGTDLDAALRLADELLTKSPYGLRHTKELLNLSLDAPGLRQHMAVENRTQTMAFFTEDFAEGLMAAAEKRAPKFNNR
ncbi:enoyl-CoA hydratase/isomerase family protein [Actinomadura scrupuli]|uniref:enoyl-CoA hydratase/isomerase family protein n=1 Tax=Actinomadura scrupuli TaxID=559629 RepID=UPI003D95235F